MSDRSRISAHGGASGGAEGNRKRWPPLSPYIAGLAVAPLLIFWQLWWPFDHLRYGFALGDFSEQLAAIRTFVLFQLRHGHLPLWDPYTLGGQPSLANPLSSTFYFPGLWQVLFPSAWTYEMLEVEALLHAALIGIFTFFLVRRWTGSAQAGFLSGLALAAGGYVTSYPMLQLWILRAATWLPAVLWALDVGVEERSYRHIALAGMGLALSLLSSHFQTALYVAYVAGSFLLWKALRRRWGWREIVQGGMVFALFALGLSAAQWLPSLQLIPYSPRAEVGYDFLSNGFRLHDLLGLLRPNPHQWSPLYIGLPAFLLALWAIIGGPRGESWFWGGWALLAVNLSLGRYGFLYPLVYRWWPGPMLFREQERWALIVAFSLAVLAGYGYAALAKRRPSLDRRAFWGLAALLFLDLWHANAGVILEPLPPDAPFPAFSPVVQQVRCVSEPTWRISSEGLLPGGANAAMVYRLRDVVGSYPLYQRSLDEFVEIVPELRWWRMLNVQHVLTRRTLGHGAFLHVLDEGDAHLYQTFIDARYAWIAHTVREAASSQEAMQITAQLDDPFTTVVLEESPSPRPEPPGGTEHIAVTDFRAERITLEVSLESPGILTVSELWYPGWRVYVNGHPAEMLRAYGLLRAVALPAGTWRVEWRFRPTIAWAGIGLSLLTALLGGYLWWRGRSEA